MFKKREPVYVFFLSIAKWNRFIDRCNDRNGRKSISNWFRFVNKFSPHYCFASSFFCECVRVPSLLDIQIYIYSWQSLPSLHRNVQIMEKYNAKTLFRSTTMTRFPYFLFSVQKNQIADRTHTYIHPTLVQRE